MPLTRSDRLPNILVVRFIIKSVLASLLVVLLVACVDLLAPALPLDSVPLAHRPIQFATWWQMTESCSGLHGDLDAVSWYMGPDPLVVDGEHYDGFWYGYGNRIVVSRGSLTDGGTVRHEMLHALLGKGEHPVEYFVKRCGALVACTISCGVAESTRGVPADARVVLPDSLVLTTSLSPDGAPATSIDSGWVTILATATNSRPEPVWVNLPYSESFSYVFRKTSGALIFSNESRWAFGAGESRSMAFDVQLPPGMRDTLWVSFGDAYGPPRAVSVAP